MAIIWKLGHTSVWYSSLYTPFALFMLCQIYLLLLLAICSVFFCPHITVKLQPETRPVRGVPTCENELPGYVCRHDWELLEFSPGQLTEHGPPKPQKSSIERESETGRRY